MACAAYRGAVRAAGDWGGMMSEAQEKNLMAKKVGAAIESEARQWVELNDVYPNPPPSFHLFDVVPGQAGGARSLNLSVPQWRSKMVSVLNRLHREQNYPAFGSADDEQVMRTASATLNVPLASSTISIRDLIWDKARPATGIIAVATRTWNRLRGV